jgi:transcriptional regulator with GAF, ATPase, and Fis domain
MVETAIIDAFAIGTLGAVFARLVAAAAPLLPHAEALLVVFSPDGLDVRETVSTKEGVREVSPAFAHWLLSDASVACVGTKVPPDNASRPWLKTPLHIGDAVHGVLVFFARPGSEYSAGDLARAESIAGMVVAMGRNGLGPMVAGADQERDAILDPSEAVLRELGDVLDVRSVFPRISEIVKRVLPHDRLTMTFHDAEGYVGLQVVSDGHPPEFGRVRVDRKVLAQPFVLLPELTPEGLADYEPREARDVLLRSGFGSFLAINLTAREQRMGVEFWAHRIGAFTLADVPLARHVASCVALAVSHEQLVGDWRERPEEAHQHARRVAVRMGALMDERRPSKRIVGQSAPWTLVMHDAARVADTETTVLLMGESGTGKEVVARFIHASSARRRGPFIAVNCAALPEQLLESELFGFERGAFTGATHPKPGQIELAAGGVLFLDEVSEMSPSAQAKFLRVLQEREFRRLGGTRLLHADIRVIAATNTDLAHAIQHGRFRRDLYYRLRVFDLRLPPLRERRDDIPALCEALLAELAERLRHPRLRLSAAARTALIRHDWPGNVRELRNVLERATIICDGDLLDLEHLSFDSEPVEGVLSTDLGMVERELIEKVLRECGGNKSQAARKLGLSRMQLYVRLRRFQGDGEALN